ncbi:MAG: histidine phosphatase family protein [Pseudomonadota bacterium]
MKTLIIMRHAKSSWSDPGARDIERPLNARGRRSAQALGEWLRFGGFQPDLVLCSTAVRTAETWAGLGLEAEVRYVRELYHAAPGVYLDAFRNASGRCVMVLGHNPGIAAFASEILAAPPSHARFDAYPTGATLVADYDGEWPQLSAGRATVRAFTVPRDLT